MYDPDEYDYVNPEDEYEGEARVARPPKQWEVGVYELDEAYGGPEEGGWWYSCGTLRGLSRKVFNSRQAAVNYMLRLQDKLYARNKKLRFGLHSVAYGGGYMDAQVYPRGESPKYYPEERPRYE